MRIILASESLLRGRALEILGLAYEKIPSGFDEDSVVHPDPATRSRMLAEEKAKVVGVNARDALIVSGDLVVVVDGEVYEKPRDAEDAARMLRAFSGKRMRMVAGIAVYRPCDGKMLSESDSYEVGWRSLSDDEIRDYVSRYPVTRFSGGFDGDGLQRFAISSEGTFPFITGLPMPLLVKFLREMGVDA